MLMHVPVLRIDRPEDHGDAHILCGGGQRRRIQSTGRAEKLRRDAAAFRHGLHAGDQIVVYGFAGHFVHIIMAAAVQPDFVALLRDAAERLRILRDPVAADEKRRVDAAGTQTVEQALGQLTGGAVVKGQRDAALGLPAGAGLRRAENEQQRQRQHCG